MTWTPDMVKDRLEEAGASLLMLRTPHNARPMGHRSNWPAEILQTNEDLFAAIVGAEDAQAAQRQRDDDKNRVRLQPDARQIARMDEALAWLWRVEGIGRQIASARMLYDPIRERHLVSWRRLSAVTGIHRDTLKARHYAALCQISRALEKNSQNVA